MRIVICGSTKFAKEIKETKESLVEKGHEIIVPRFTNDWANGKIIKGVEDEAKRKKDYNLICSYFKRIKESNAILVLNYKKDNIAGYIGGSTFLEIGFAHVLNKKIYVLNPLPKMSYLDEMKTMDPIILNGNLDLIK